MIDPRTLTDDVLIETIARLAARCRETTADLIAHLVVLEERNLHLACGFNSLFGYCHRVLGCSESASYDRMQAARAARRFPVVLALLADGSLHLTAVRLLAPHLKDEDHLALLGGARRKSGRKVRELLARWFPQPDVPALVRRLPEVRQRPATATAPAPAGAATSDRPTDAPAIKAAGANSGDTASGPAVAPKPQAPVAQPPRRAVEPLAPGRHLFRFTGDDESVALLREAQELLSHSIPKGDIAAIFKRALVLVVAQARRDRHASTSRPRASASSNEEPEDPASRSEVYFAPIREARSES